MDLRKLIVSSFLLTSSAVHSAVDNQLIQTKSADSIALAGRIGEAAIFSVQADDDNDAEILATASSLIDQMNDHWILLDWDGADYQIIKTGALQSTDKHFTAAYQNSFGEIILGQENGALTTITFTDDPDNTDHFLTETQTQLSQFTHGLGVDVDLDEDVKAIVKLDGTNQISYQVVCTENYLHVLDGVELKSSLDMGGYCQSGNVDYEEISLGIYDEELVLETGKYLTFDGTSWTEKTSLVGDSFGGDFKIANIDDDDAAEILSQANANQVQSFAALGGSWVYISQVQSATGNFNAFDTDGDDISEIFFDYIHTADEPHEASLSSVAWDSTKDTHATTAKVTSPHLDLTAVEYLPTQINAGVPSNYSLFVSNANTANPNGKLLYQVAPTTLATEWNGLLATATRSFDTLTKTTVNNDIADFAIVQLEQIDLGNDNYEFAFKFIDATTLSQINAITPDYSNDEMVSVSTFESVDYDGDGIDELHAGGNATYSAKVGLVLSSNLDGSDHNRLDTTSIEAVTAMYIGDVNLLNSTDIIATGKENNGNGIGIHLNIDGNNSAYWYAPGSGETDFNSLVASNIKGEAEPEILGLHSSLTSIDPNAATEDSFVYNLTNLDLSQFTPITLENRDYDFALATDALGNLFLVEPKDFDILASVEACDVELSALSTVRIQNNTDVVVAICDDILKSWVVEYDINIQDYGYSLYELASYDLGNLTDGNNSQLTSITTDDATTHLFAFTGNKFMRFELNIGLGENSDADEYSNYRDAFPLEDTQWADADFDGLGDNPAPAVNPDPSLNDIDNDGVLDDVDPDNIPENDLNPANDNDHGAPKIVSALTDLSISATGELTNVSLTTPSVTDVYHDAEGLGDPAVSASVANVTLTDNTGTFDGDFESGLYSILWTATDDAGNSVSESQSLSVYPIIGFETSTSTIGETQTSQILVTLSGSSPVYPVEVELSVTLGTASNNDVSINTDEAITLSFAEGETEKTVQIYAVDEDSVESDETLTLTLTDTFAPNEWTVNPAASTHELTIREANRAPVVNVTVSQNGEETDSPTVLDGTVTLQSIVTDANTGDTHSYLWNLSSLGLGDSLLESVAFDPSSKAPGLYSISLTVTDNGLPNKVEIHTFNLTLDYGDSDGDGYKDNVDAFPNSITEWSDRDGDGYSDQVGDAFPDLASEYKDSDGDGVGDKADQFDDDPNEQFDADGDGVGDEADAFPNDPNETLDSDGDGVGDNADEFPGDPKKSNEVEEESVSTGSLSHLALLLLLGMVYRRRTAK